jgi:hypothetical protein
MAKKLQVPERVQARLPAGTLSLIDAARGDTPLHLWLRELIERELERYETAQKKSEPQ